LPTFGLPVLRTMLAMKLVLLILGATLAVRLGPFTNGDGWPAVATGLTLVSAMSIQNAVHRIHLGSAPPTTLMTGTTTQIMIDLADLLNGAGAEKRIADRARIRRMATSVGAFAVGCAAAAGIFAGVGVWCFVFPPLIGLWSLFLSLAAFPGDDK
jgi:uncharacterized membrane protein YoaK (UPF0700 family)